MNVVSLQRLPGGTEGKKEELFERTSEKSTLYLPDLVAFVLVADGQQIQQDLIEVAKSKVYTHHCNCIPRGHLRAAGRAEKEKNESC